MVLCVVNSISLHCQQVLWNLCMGMKVYVMWYISDKWPISLVRRSRCFRNGKVCWWAECCDKTHSWELFCSSRYSCSTNRTMEFSKVFLSVSAWWQILLLYEYRTSKSEVSCVAELSWSINFCSNVVTNMWMEVIWELFFIIVCKRTNMIFNLIILIQWNRYPSCLVLFPWKCYLSFLSM
jgi:hypothetical protein